MSSILQLSVLVSAVGLTAVRAKGTIGCLKIKEFYRF